MVLLQSCCETRSIELDRSRAPAVATFRRRARDEPPSHEASTMGHFSEVLSRHGITPAQLVRASQRLEAATRDDVVLVEQRRRHRLQGEGRSYAEASVAKPRSGRGLTVRQAALALAGAPLPPRPRAKALRAVNHLLEAARRPPLDAAALFGTTGALRHGKAAPQPQA
jgi:hypothetical protein